MTENGKWFDSDSPLYPTKQPIGSQSKKPNYWPKPEHRNPPSHTKQQKRGMGFLTFLIIAAVGLFLFLVWIAPNNVTSTIQSTILVASSTTIRTTTPTTTSTIPTYTGCTAELPFQCQNPLFSKQGLISFNLSQKDNVTLYNINLACTASSQPNLPSSNQFYALQSDGTLNQSNYGTSISNGQVIEVQNLNCSGIESNRLSFNGNIWLNYTPHSGSASQFNPWFTNKAQVYVNTTSQPG
jgi:hypothetical protein